MSNDFCVFAADPINSHIGHELKCSEEFMQILSR